MNKEKLLALMPKVVVQETDIEKQIQEEKELMAMGKKFASQLSINRYLPKPLGDLSFEEKVHLFSFLHEEGVVYGENALYFSDLDYDAFLQLLEEKFNLKEPYGLDEYYIEKLLQGVDITQEEFVIGEEETSFREILEQFVLTTWDMGAGDTPNLMLMLVVKKALLGAYFAEKNVAILQEGKREIYDVSILK